MCVHVCVCMFSHSCQRPPHFSPLSSPCLWWFWTNEGSAGAFPWTTIWCLLSWPSVFSQARLCSCKGHTCFMRGKLLDTESLIMLGLYRHHLSSAFSNLFCLFHLEHVLFVLNTANTLCETNVLYFYVFNSSILNRSIFILWSLSGHFMLLSAALIW